MMRPPQPDHTINPPGFPRCGAGAKADWSPAKGGTGRSRYEPRPLQKLGCEDAIATRVWARTRARGAELRVRGEAALGVV